MSVIRLSVEQAQEKYPNETWGTLGGAVAHACVERLELPPRFILNTRCGRAGFADDTVDLHGMCCLRCLRKLASAEDTE
jgi:hypothetical protein